MTTDAPNAYDAVAYPSHCCPQAHPDRLATLAILFGLSPALPGSCRFLELGCGDGGNLLALAFALPRSEFVGVDLAPGAIGRAVEEARALGLGNVHFHCADLLDWTPPGGPFDYVIAHGLFSWVPEAVRLRVLEICRDRLAPNGVAYVSYNALPGRHVRIMLAEMMRYHVRRHADPAEKVAQARDFLRFLLAGQPVADPLTALLRAEAERILTHDAAPFLFHDDLAEINHAFYFHEFMGLAARHGLQFLAEAEFSAMQESMHPAPALAALRRYAGDVVAKEQYLDFLRCRRFRQTLLCREGLTLRRGPEPAAVRRLLVASQAEPRSARPDLTAGVRETFASPHGLAMQADDPLTKAALLELRAAWPRALPFDRLVEAARRRLGAPAAPDDADRLAADVLDAYAGAMVELRLHQPAWAPAPGARPVLCPLARAQLTDGRQAVTSLLHADVLVEAPLLRELFLLLDGSRDVPAVAAEVCRRVDAGGLTLPGGVARKDLPEAVAAAVRDAAAKALLIAWDEGA